MKTANKVIINTIVLYSKILINLIISLWSVPIILKALGESDYGLYNLVAGVIAMLSFLNSAMTISTQRYMSVFMGKKDFDNLNSVYNSSIILHLIIGLFIVFLFEICGFFIFDGFLQIDSNRVSAAKTIYQFLIVSTFLTIITVPYNAVINAYEDMLAFSVIGIVDSILKLLLAFWLTCVNYDKLIFYGFGVAIITLINVTCSRFFVKIKYKTIKFQLGKYYNKSLIKEMLSFSGWNAFGGLAMIGRNQGISVVLNLFFGTVINAAYGIANQVNSVLLSFCQTLQQSINPQLMKSEGMNNSSRMLRIAFMSSKYSVLLLSAMAIPLIIEMPYILLLWLKIVPQNTIEFCRLILILSIIYEYSVGIMSAIQSHGIIKQYQIVMCALLLANIPIAYFLIKYGFPAYSVLVGFIILEIIALCIRLLFAKNLVKLDVLLFIKRIIIPTFIGIVFTFAVGSTVTFFLSTSFARVVIITLICLATFGVFSWLIIMDKDEQLLFKNLIHDILHYNNRKRLNN